MHAAPSLARSRPLNGPLHPATLRSRLRIDRSDIREMHGSTTPLSQDEAPSRQSATAAETASLVTIAANLMIGSCSLSPSADVRQPGWPEPVISSLTLGLTLAAVSEAALVLSSLACSIRCPVGEHSAWTRQVA